MAKIVVGVFDDFTVSKIMVSELINEGFTKEAVSVMAPDNSVEANRYFNSTPATHSEDE